MIILKVLFFLFRLLFITLFLVVCLTLILFLFKPIFYAENLIFPYSVTPFDLCTRTPTLWKYIKLSYLFTFSFSVTLVSNSLFSSIFKFQFVSKPKIKKINLNNLHLLIGKSAENNTPVYITETSLYQNILITGTIGTGKTSSAMYPFCNQLISYKKDVPNKKLAMLILDVKGNFYKQVLNYCLESKRLNDLIIISLDGSIKYNPLDKPNLKAHVLANRLKEILLLFSPNNTESYWLDVVEQALTEAIKLCRIYNNKYVTFTEIHNLLTSKHYYNKKLEIARNLFTANKLCETEIYNLLSSIKFFENNFYSLDTKILSTLQSEISRITNIFISDHDISKIFCPSKSEITFNGFEDILNSGKIVVLNMNLSEYKNLSKIIAAYLKLDFQSEILSQLSKKNPHEIRASVFICDEYHEYVTASDANFFSQSREAKSINIVATQSYTSIYNTLKDQYATKVIIQNLVNKIWFRTDDIYTIEEIQKQLGKEDKIKISKNISENANTTSYNHFTNSLTSQNSNISESISSYTNYDFIYDFNFFTCKLPPFNCLTFLSNNLSTIYPQKLIMLPCFKKNTTFKFNKFKII